MRAYVSPPAEIVPALENTVVRQEAKAYEIERTNWVIEVVFYSCTAFIWCSVGCACALHMDNKWDLLWMAYLSAVPADLFSGVLHWLLDCYNPPFRHSAVERSFLVFKIHHDEPQLIAQHDLHAVDYEALLLTMVVIVGLSLSGTYIWEDPFWAMACVWGGFSNRFHRWAHMPNPPVVARALQSARLILTPEHHAKHHVPPHLRNYCISSGLVTNPILDAIGFWPAMEWLVRRTTGIRTSRMNSAKT